MYYDVQRPLYTVVQYTETIYKVIKFKRSNSGLPRFDDKSEFDDCTKVKFDSSISRACKMVFEFAICNNWDYFFTGTIDASKHDRYDWDSIRDAFKEFVKYRSRKYKSKVLYLLVPERHADGAWHMHGFISGIPSEYLASFKRGEHPYKLVKSGYLNWPEYSEKFGFCSLGPIKNKTACSYYVTKYIRKDIASRRDEVGKHLYTASKGLLKAQKSFDVYTPSKYLDQFLSHDYDFCSTGIIEGQDWFFGIDFENAEFEEIAIPEYAPSDEDIKAVDRFAEYEQLIIKGW